MSIQRTQQTSVQIHRIEIPTPFAVGPVNAYLVQSNGENILVDCGPNTTEARTALEEGLRRHGVDISLLTGVVLTHGHVDHAGLAGHLQARGVSVFSHKDVQYWLEPGGAADIYRDTFFRALYYQMGMPDDAVAKVFEDFFFMRKLNDWSVVDHPIEDGMTFLPIPSFQVVEVPGHAQAAIALFSARTGDLIIGDQLLKSVSANAFVEPIFGAKQGSEAKRSRSLIDYRENLRRLHAMEVKMVYPGHGAPFYGASALIEKRLQEHFSRAEVVSALLHQYPNSTAWSLACEMFPRHLNQPSLILSEVLGFLDWMEAEHRVASSVNASGIVTWTCCE